MYSVLGVNERAICTKYGMNLNNLLNIWNERCVTVKKRYLNM